MRSQSGDRRKDKPTEMAFLVSFLVDARGGAMTGSRRSGIRIVIPPRCAEQPVRITVRQLRPECVLHSPPLSEGEGLACRILQLTPATFLAPILLEVPHFTPLGDNREIVVLRSDTGKKWTLHTNCTNTHHIETFLTSSSISHLSESNNNHSKVSGPDRVSTIYTSTLPQFFAVLTRPKQETKPIGQDGGLVISSLTPQVQCMFPPRSLTKHIHVGVSVFPVTQSEIQELGRQGVSSSPVVTIEPRRRKFHKAITVTIPLPKLINSGNTSSHTVTSNASRDQGINNYLNDNLMLLCSMSGAGSRSVWEDVTLSSPLTVSEDCVQFTTIVSAQFWLFHLPPHLTEDKHDIAEKLFRAITRVPYMVRLWLYWRQVQGEEDGEAEVRLVMCTEGERVEREEGEGALEDKEGFLPIARSDEVELKDRSHVELTLTGNLSLTDSSPTKLQFKPFAENRATFSIKRQDRAAPGAGSLHLSGRPRQVLYSGPLFLPLTYK